MIEVLHSVEVPVNAAPVDTTVDTTVNAATVGATVDATAEGGEVEHVDGEDNEDAMETTAVLGSSDAATSAAAASSSESESVSARRVFFSRPDLGLDGWVRRNATF
eukprot:COSAG06_NODE_924_length_11533_cov_65.691998_7_plen_106_part_00